MFKRFIYTVILSVLTLTSCNSIMDEGVCSEGDGIVRKVTFTLAMDEESRQTRASWESGYIAEDAVDYENRIAYDGLRVLFYTSSNRYVGEVANMMHWPISETEYKFSGDVTSLNLALGAEYKIMVLANCPETTTDINGLYYSIADADYPKGYIPMWGVGLFTPSGDELQDAGTIDLLRSMAKIEVVLSNEMLANGYTLDEVSLNHYNSTGYSLPNGWNSVAKTIELDQEYCMRAYHSHVTSVLPLKEVVENKSFWVYVPEFNVLHSSDNRPNLNVTLIDGTSVPLEFPGSIRFGTYDANGELVEDSEVNIVRNHIYRFNIVGISSGLEIEYEVMDWEYDEAENKWERGEFAYPTYHNPVVPDYLNPSAPIVTAPVMKYNNGVNPEEDAFVVWFKMDKPAEQTWTPVLDQSETDYEIRVYKSDNPAVRLTDPADWVADPDHWYKIVILPLKADNAGVVAKFGITYTQNWMPDGSSLYLFINGKVDEIAWPESGDDPKIIEIKQI